MRDPFQAPTYKIAPMGRRMGAAIIDLFAVGLVWFAFMKLYGEWVPEEATWRVTGSPALMLFAITAAYWILPEWLFGATLGKWGCDLKVVGLDGSTCSLGQSLKRNLLRMLDWGGLYLIGFVAAKLSKRSQRLGDQWARTVVVTAESLALSTTAPSPTETHTADKI